MAKITKDVFIENLFNKSIMTEIRDLVDSTHFLGHPHNLKSVNAATNLTNEDCGTIILGEVGTAQADGTGFNVNLPAPKSGAHFKFILAAPSIANADGAQITIKTTSDGTTAADLAVGSVTVNNVTTNVTAVADEITFVKAAATAGDYVKCVSDGTNWFVEAFGDAAACITLD